MTCNVLSLHVILRGSVTDVFGKRDGLTAINMHVVYRCTCSRYVPRYYHVRERSTVVTFCTGRGARTVLMAAAVTRAGLW
jgi:hypothetical protein